jgi:hypothetical protein
VEEHSDLVAAIGAEGRRHLTFEELESCLLNEESLDPRGRRHLASCETCRAELTDLRQFDALPVRSVPEVETPAPRPWWLPSWRFAGAMAGVLLAAVVVWRLSPAEQDVLQLTVQVPAARPTAILPPTTLRPDGGPVLPNDIQLAIEKAQLAAERTRQEQTIELQIERRLLDALLTRLRAAGRLGPGAEAPESEPDTVMRIAVTFVPAG